MTVDAATVQRHLSDIASGAVEFTSFDSSCELVECLLATGCVGDAQLNSTATDSGLTMLALCVARCCSAYGSRSTSTVDALLRAGADVNKASDRKGDYDVGTTPLQIAAGEGCAKVVALLLTARADVERVNQHGWTPLLLAVRKRFNFQAVRLLLEAGADVGLKRVIVYSQRGLEEWVTSPLHIAVHPQIVGVLISAGADVNAQDSRGRTPLHNALQHRSVSSIRNLLVAGARLDRGPSLYCAARSGCIEALVLFLAAGAVGSVRRLSCNIDCAVLLLVSGAFAVEALQVPHYSRTRWVEWVRICNEGGTAFSDAAKQTMKRIELAGFNAIRGRIMEVCIALHEKNLPALLLVEIVTHACAPFAANLPFHCLWDAVVCVKHKRLVRC
jgi:ankyrin repeat protein